jgi:hypothetical protein
MVTLRRWNKPPITWIILNMEIASKITEKLIMLKIIGFLDFVHRPELENTTFRKLDLFPSPGEERESPTLLGPLERADLNHWTFSFSGIQQIRCLLPIT